MCSFWMTPFQVAYFQGEVCEFFPLTLFTAHQVTALVYIKIDTCIDLDKVQKNLQRRYL